MSEKGFTGNSNRRSGFFKRYTDVWEAFLAIIVGFFIGGLVISWSGFDAIAAILRMLEGRCICVEISHYFFEFFCFA